MSGDQKIQVNVFAARPEEMAHLDLLGGPAACGWPSIDSSEWAKGLDRLAAAVSGRAMDEFGEHELVFPPGAADWDGPWLVRVPDDVVRTIAELDAEAISRYLSEVRAQDTTPEVPEDTRRRLHDLRELCHRACDEHRHVYQWSTE
jgi:hypothetical protein